MCGRFTLTTPISEIAKRFNVEAVHFSEMPPHYNIAPGQDVVIITHNEGAKQLFPCRWGFLPFWAKNVAMAHRMINARAETIRENPAFRCAFRDTRCLVAANGFYEWENKNGKKYPVYITLKSEEPFGFAGLYNIWHSPGGDVLPTCVIITTNANDLVAHVHDRMPVIMPEDKEEMWLDPSLDAKRASQILKPYPAEEMDLYYVSLRMNSPAYDDSKAIQRM